MPSARSSRRTIHRTRIRWNRVLGLLVVAGAIVVAVGELLPASPVTTTSVTTAPASTQPAEPPPVVVRRSEYTAALGEADGAVPEGTTVFDDHVPAVANLAPDLRDALRRAANQAAGAGVRLVVTSGWRSRAYQEHLRQRAIAEHGSEAEGARWALPADKSLHVSGDAVDLGPAAATAWLAAHGAAFGLCRTYTNEPWHFELRPEAPAGGCPAPYPDPTHDPRMQP